MGREIISLLDCGIDEGELGINRLFGNLWYRPDQLDDQESESSVCRFCGLAVAS